MESTLPSKLLELTDAIVDRDFAARLAEVFNAAALCIEALQNINLAPLEPQDAGESSADLTMWESAAPALADTVVAINGLVAAIEEHFHNRASPSAIHGNEYSDDRAVSEATLVFQAVSAQLKQGIESVRVVSRDPRFVANRWALLAELQRLRGEFRGRVGDAVFLAAAACAPVRRDEVVPHAAQEVARALVYRQTAAELVRQLRARLAKMTDPRALATGVLEDVKFFSTMPAWKHVRAAPKRQLLELKLSLSKPSLAIDEARADVEAFIATVTELSTDLTDSVLVQHDRDIANEVRERLEQARLHLSLGTGGATGPLLIALERASVLRGRSEVFDVTVKQLKKAGEFDQSLAEQKTAVATLERALAPEHT